MGTDSKCFWWPLAIPQPTAEQCHEEIYQEDPHHLNTHGTLPAPRSSQGWNGCLRGPRRGGEMGALGMLGWFQAGFQGGEGKGSSRRQQLEAVGSSGSRQGWRRGLRGWDAQQECRIRAGWMGRTEPAKLCRREMAARLGLETNPSCRRPPIPGSGCADTFLYSGNCSALGPTPAPQPWAQAQRDTVCLWHSKPLVLTGMLNWLPGVHRDGIKGCWGSSPPPSHTMVSPQGTSSPQPTAGSSVMQREQGVAPKRTFWDWFVPLPQSAPQSTPSCPSSSSGLW